MKQQFNLSQHLEGHFKMKYLKSGLIYEQKNTILGSAIQIVTGRLAGLASSAIDYIKVYNTSTLKAAKLIQSTTQVSTNEVEFFAIFDEADFFGAFDEAQLWCNSIGPFAGVTGLVQTKPTDEKLAITWKIKLI